ncbi:MAG: redox-regulated ATPase YchF [Candidatus Thermoplasmatota archaeon]
MEVGIVGKPNVGKSTFFCAATLAPAVIADYPFTTIEPNRGVAYVRANCPHKDFNVTCTPRNSKCIDGIRYVSIDVIDVAGLVPDAHKGRGLGNKFLDDLRQARILIHIVDASGTTDFEGKACEGHDPLQDINFLEEEIAHWIKGIISKGWEKDRRVIEIEGGKVEKIIADKLTGLGINENTVHSAVSGISDKPPNRWKDEELYLIASRIRELGKPIIIAANKWDVAPEENREKLMKRKNVIPTCAEYELALRRAAKAGLISYVPGASSFEILKPDAITKQQSSALKKIIEYLEEYKDTGVQKCNETAIFKLLELITVYPVEDEVKLTDKDGRVLPDVYLMEKGSTARDLAYKVHTDLGKGFIRAINARTKRTVGSDYKLNEGDVIKIVSSM